MGENMLYVVPPPISLAKLTIFFLSYEAFMRTEKIKKEERNVSFYSV
jgi:hypothetical protein